jgi:hypothetical protein
VISIYTIGYNEELLAQFFINHYKSNFPDCKITLFDNCSTDKTKDIFESNGCKVENFDTGGLINENEYLRIKNNCWKQSATDWVLICDIDEILHINQHELLAEHQKSVSIIRTEAYEMYNSLPYIDIENMKHGVRLPIYDKSILFNKQKIKQINYSAGCHTSNPEGDVLYSENKYKMLHYKGLSEDYVVARHKEFAERLSDENKKNNWGSHYLIPEKELRLNYRNIKTEKVI